MDSPEDSLYGKGVRQGCLLSCSSDDLLEDARKCIEESRSIKDKRGSQVSEKGLLVVISQDCDINNPHEKYIEVIFVKEITERKANSLRQNNRSYKYLQLSFNDKLLEFEASLISVVPKSIFSQVRVVAHLDDRYKTILIDWRVSRYNRIPFPDRFNKDFLGYIKSPRNELGLFLEKNNKDVLEIFANVYPPQEGAEKYSVSITVLIDEKTTVELEQSLKKMLHKHIEILHNTDNSLNFCQIDQSYTPPGSIVPLDLVLRQSDFTMFDLVNLSRITLDYLCY